MVGGSRIDQQLDLNKAVNDMATNTTAGTTTAIPADPNSVGLLGISLNDFTEKQKQLLGMLAETLTDLVDVEDVLTQVTGGSVGGEVTIQMLLTEVTLRAQAKAFNAKLETNGTV